MQITKTFIAACVLLVCGALILSSVAIRAGIESDIFPFGGLSFVVGFILLIADLLGLVDWLQKWWKDSFGGG